MMLMNDIHLIYENQKKHLTYMNEKAGKQREQDDYKADNVISMTLGPHYTPGPFDVICARGKQAFQHAGNRYFRNLVKAATEKYKGATSKLERTIIVSEVIDAIRAKGNGFVRKNDQGEWVECDEILAREKTGQLFRNSLGTKYKSSVKSKRKKRELNQPNMIESVHDILFSNPKADRIMKELTAEVTSGILSDHDVYEKFCVANINLLRVFKDDRSLSSRFVEVTQV